MDQADRIEVSSKATEFMHRIWGAQPSSIDPPNQLRLYFSAMKSGKDIKMKSLENLKIIGITLLLLAGLAACDTKPGPAESAGKKIDQSANEAGKKIGETVDKVGAKMNDQSAKTSVALDDAEITARVKAAIFAEPGLQTLQISVETVNGVVTLSGSVDSLPNSERAKGLAGAVSGVTSVENKLVLKSN